MSMQSHYCINVAAQIPESVGKPFGPHYAHLFATAEHSLRDEDDVKRAYQEIVARFPAPAFKVDVTRWEARGHGIDHAFLMGLTGQERIKIINHFRDWTGGFTPDEAADQIAPYLASAIETPYTGDRLTAVETFLRNYPESR